MHNVTPSLTEDNIKPAYLRYVPKIFYGSSHWWALCSAKNLPVSSSVLDIGAGSGIIGQELKEAGFTRLHAVEIDEETRKAIAPIYSSVELSLASFRNMRFDLILLLDILEHLDNPRDFYREAISLLAPGGMALISVPNIAHWSVRVSLIFGSFPYTERGILDKTHLQHFTRHRLEELVRSEPEVSIIEISSSIEPLELLLPRWVWDNSIFRTLSRLRRFCARSLPGILAYQHLIIVRRLP